jgi:hypothetical protein
MRKVELILLLRELRHSFDADPFCPSTEVGGEKTVMIVQCRKIFGETVFMRSMNKVWFHSSTVTAKDTPEKPLTFWTHFANRPFE